jgi:hypothetical protein
MIMELFTSERPGLLSNLAHGDWSGRSRLGRREEYLGPDARLVVAGVIMLGLGLAAWHFLGPDVRRYLKIRNM